MKKTLPPIFKVENSLGSLESQVMDIVWNQNKSLVREVFVCLNVRKPIAYTTVMTVMDNLYKKGFLKRVKVEKSYHYSPIFEKSSSESVSLASVFGDLKDKYGRKRILYFALGSTLAMPHIKIVPSAYAKTVGIYKAPVAYGSMLTVGLVLLGFSIFDLAQNIRILGTLEYLNLLKSEPSLFFSQLRLFVSAFVESLPLINISVSVLCYAFVFLLMKKFWRVTNFKIA